jgi:hypothetical protein
LNPDIFDLLESLPFGLWQSGFNKEESSHTDSSIDPARFGSTQGVVKKWEGISKDDACIIAV